MEIIAVFHSTMRCILSYGRGLKTIVQLQKSLLCFPMIQNKASHVKADLWIMNEHGSFHVCSPQNMKE